MKLKAGRMNIYYNNIFMNIEKIIKENKGTVVDVRSAGEFKGGHVAGSVNIPLSEISARIEELKKLRSPLILCCASGNRSGQAFQYLTQQGIESINGGSWFDVHECLTQKTT
jgi:phage shock protein E